MDSRWHAGRWNVLLTILILSGLCGCTTMPPPPLGAELPADFETARAQFNQRVKERFPAGTSEQSLLEELRQQRFHVEPASSPALGNTSYASYHAEGFPCARRWTLEWNAEQGRITAIEGLYRAICL